MFELLCSDKMLIVLLHYNCVLSVSIAARCRTAELKTLCQLCLNYVQSSDSLFALTDAVRAMLQC